MFDEALTLHIHIDTASSRIIWKLDQDQSQGKLLHQQLTSTNIKCKESNIAHMTAWDWDWREVAAGAGAGPRPDGSWRQTGGG